MSAARAHLRSTLLEVVALVCATTFTASTRSDMLRALGAADLMRLSGGGRAQFIIRILVGCQGVVRFAVLLREERTFRQGTDWHTVLIAV